MIIRCKAEEEMKAIQLRTSPGNANQNANFLRSQCSRRCLRPCLVFIATLCVFMASSIPSFGLNGYPPYYWVVYGNSYPPLLVNGPFDNSSPYSYDAFQICNQIAQTYNRVYTDWRFHCELH